MSSEQRVFKKITWEVPNITKQFLWKEDAEGKTFYSKNFSIFFGENFTEWKLGVVPVQERTKDVGMYLYLASYSTLNFQSDYKLAIHNPKTNREVSVSSQKSGQQFAEASFGNWGFTFCQNQKLVRNFDEFVVNRRLTVICELTITPHPEIAKTQPTFFSEMFQNNSFADFTLIAVKDGVQTESFKCHKLVLAQKSKFFMRMLNEGFKGAQGGKCEISDLSANAIQEMLRFMYCEKIEGFDEITLELIFAAEKYEIKELKNFWIGNYLKNINESNVINVLGIANQVQNVDQVFGKCVEVIKDNFQKISQKEDWTNLPRPLLLKTYDLMLKDTGGSSVKFF